MRLPQLFDRLRPVTYKFIDGTSNRTHMGMIAQEIVKRYYYQRGSIIQQLKEDKDLKEAVKVLTDAERYKSLLSVPVKEEKKAE